jgi:hypothetical protein
MFVLTLQMLHDAEFVKKGFLYHLVGVPAYSTMHSSDGKVSKKPVGARFWQMQGPPWRSLDYGEHGDLVRARNARQDG